MHSDFWKAQVEQINVTREGQIEMVPRVGDHLLITGATTGVVECDVTEIRLGEGPSVRSVQETKKGDVSSIPLSDKVRRGDKVYLFQ